MLKKGGVFLQAYYINIKDICYEKEVEFLLNLVSEKKRKRALRFKRKEDRIRTLIGDILVRNVFCQKFNCKNEDVEYEYNEYKKPYIKGKENFFFNISHSGDFVCAAFDDEEIGIDVEKIDKMHYEDIAERFFAKEEYEWLIKQDVSYRINCFYKLWTLKESYVKLKGRGLGIPFDSFSFNVDYKNNIYELNKPKEEIYLSSYNLDDSYELSLCSLKKESKIEQITYEQLVESIKKFI